MVCRVARPEPPSGSNVYRENGGTYRGERTKWDRLEGQRLVRRLSGRDPRRLRACRDRRLEINSDDGGDDRKGGQDENPGDRSTRLAGKRAAARTVGLSGRVGQTRVRPRRF